MRIYTFTGDRGEIVGSGRTLRKGDEIELDEVEADRLIHDQNFPLTELQTSANETSAQPAPEV